MKGSSSMKLTDVNSSIARYHSHVCWLNNFYKSFYTKVELSTLTKKVIHAIDFHEEIKQHFFFFFWRLEEGCILNIIFYIFVVRRINGLKIPSVVLIHLFSNLEVIYIYIHQHICLESPHGFK